MQQELRSYYILGYYTTNTKEDGKYPQDRGEAEQQPVGQARVSATATTPARSGASSTAQDKEQQLKEALSAGDPLTDLPLALRGGLLPRFAERLFRAGFGEDSGVGGGAGAKKGGAGETEFDFVGQIQDERKAVVGNVRDFIKVKLDAGEGGEVARRNFHYDAGFTLAPGRYRMKFLVRENAVGQDGHVRHALRGAGPGGRFHDAEDELGGLEQPARAAEGRGGRGGEDSRRRDAQPNPLIVGQEKVVPNITKVFRRDQNLYISFDVYDARARPGESAGAPRRGEHEPVQPEGRQGVRSRTAGAPRNWRHAARRGAGASYRCR